MSDSLASLRQMLAASSNSVPGIQQPAAPMAPSPPVQQALTPTKAATAVAKVPKKKFDSVTLMLVSGGLLLCVYVYFKYFRKTSLRTGPIQADAPRPPHRPSPNHVKNPTSDQESNKPSRRVRFDDEKSNTGPTIEEIHDDSDLVQSNDSSVEKDKQVDPPPPEPDSSAKASDPKKGPKTADSQDPNFQPLRAQEVDDPDL